MACDSTKIMMSPKISQNTEFEYATLLKNKPPIKDKGMIKLIFMNGLIRGKAIDWFADSDGRFLYVTMPAIINMVVPIIIFSIQPKS